MERVLSNLPFEYMPHSIVILGEVWKPCDSNDWLPNINKRDVGNFTKVKLGAWPRYKKCVINGQTEKTIVFGEDTVCKLHPTSKCKHLNEQQYKNFFAKCTRGEANKLYYYAFNNVSNWKVDGGCVIVPKCTTDGCDVYGCRKHLNLKAKPSTFKAMHLCDFDTDKQVCLLSSRQMIISSFLKTKSTKPIPVRTKDHACMNYVIESCFDDDDDNDCNVGIDEQHG